MVFHLIGEKTLKYVGHINHKRNYCNKWFWKVSRVTAGAVVPLGTRGIAQVLVITPRSASRGPPQRHSVLWPPTIRGQLGMFYDCCPLRSTASIQRAIWVHTSQEYIAFVGASRDPWTRGQRWVRVWAGDDECVFPTSNIRICSVQEFLYVHLFLSEQINQSLGGHIVVS